MKKKNRKPLFDVGKYLDPIPTCPFPLSRAKLSDFG